MEGPDARRGGPCVSAPLNAGAEELHGAGTEVGTSANGHRVRSSRGGRIRTGDPLLPKPMTGAHQRPWALECALIPFPCARQRPWTRVGAGTETGTAENRRERSALVSTTEEPSTAFGGPQGPRPAARSLPPGAGILSPRLLSSPSGLAGSSPA